MIGDVDFDVGGIGTAVAGEEFRGAVFFEEFNADAVITGSEADGSERIFRGDHGVRRYRRRAGRR